MEIDHPSVMRWNFSFVDDYFHIMVNYGICPRIH